MRAAVTSDFWGGPAIYSRAHARGCGSTPRDTRLPCGKLIYDRDEAAAAAAVAPHKGAAGGASFVDKRAAAARRRQHEARDNSTARHRTCLLFSVQAPRVTAAVRRAGHHPMSGVRAVASPDVVDDSASPSPLPLPSPQQTMQLARADATDGEKGGARSLFSDQTLQQLVSSICESGDLNATTTCLLKRICGLETHLVKLRSEVYSLLHPSSGSDDPACAKAGRRAVGAQAGRSARCTLMDAQYADVYPELFAETPLTQAMRSATADDCVMSIWTESMREYTLADKTVRATDTIEWCA